MIIPKFNEKRIASPDSVADPIDKLAKPIAKIVDKQHLNAVKAHNNKMKADQAKAVKVWNQKQEAKKQAVNSQDKAAKSYINKGKNLTAAQKKQNEAAKSYMSYDPTTVSVKVKSTSRKPAAKTGAKPKNPVNSSKVAGQSGGAAGRPKTDAGTKPIKPNTPSTPKTTVNKTASRNVRGATKPPTVKPVAKITKPAGVGRRTNGAPKSK
jgi:hypothetical protein